MNTDIIDSFTETKSLTTQLSYRNAYKKFSDYLGKPVEECSHQEIIDLLRIMYKNDKEQIISTNTKLSYLNIAIVLAKFTNKKKFSFSKIEKFRDELQNQAYKEKVEKNKELKETLPSIEILNRYTNQLYNDERYVDFIINFLLIHTNVRNRDLMIKVIKSTKEIIPEEDFNYLILRETYVEYRRYNYKTENTYGTKSKRIKSVKLIKALENIIDERENFDESPYLILCEGGEPATELNIGKKIQEMTYNNLGEGNYLKISILDLQKKEPEKLLKKLSAISENRGTSIETLKNDYNIM